MEALAITKQLVYGTHVKAKKAARVCVLSGEQLYKAEALNPANEMKNVKFKVEESEGYLVAAAVDYAIVTQAKTWLNLMRNIDDAVRLHFELKKDEKYNLELDIDSEVIPLVRKSAKA